VEFENHTINKHQPNHVAITALTILHIILATFTVTMEILRVVKTAENPGLGIVFILGRLLGVFSNTNRLFLEYKLTEVSLL
jgi:hypothetical protein